MHPNDGRVVSNFIVQALLSKPVTVYGDGSQTRSFCYVDDQVDVMTRLMESPDEFIGTMNAGNPKEFTIKELAELTIELTGTKSNIEYKPLPKDDPKQRCPDISLATSKVGWTPKVSLQDGLQKTIEYFDAMLSEKNIVRSGK